MQCGRPTQWRPFGGTFDRPALLERRPDLKQVLLDAANTFTESPYLDIVNEVLERLVGDDPYETLRAWSHPFGLPFALRSERLKKYLHYLQVSPEELYRLFASRVDHDIVAREYLGPSPEDIAVVTKGLTADGIRLLWGDGSAAVPFAWFERAGVEGCSGDILSARTGTTASGWQPPLRSPRATSSTLCGAIARGTTRWSRVRSTGGTSG